MTPTSPAGTTQILKDAECRGEQLRWVIAVQSCVLSIGIPSLGTVTMLIVQAERTDHSKHRVNSHPGAETGCVSIEIVRSTLSSTTHSVKRFILNVDPGSYYHALKGKQIFKSLGFTSIACHYTKLHSLRGVSVNIPALSLVVRRSRIKSDTDACQKQLIFYYQCVIQ